MQKLIDFVNNPKGRRLFVFGLLFIVSFIVMFFIQAQTALYLDDFFCCFWHPNDFLKIFTNPDHGSVVAFGLNQLTAFYLPEFFNIHPQVFVKTYGLYLRICLFLLLPFIAMKFVFMKHKNLILEILTYILMFLLMFNAVKYCINDLAMATAFYRLTLPLILMSVFVYFFVNLYVYSKKLTGFTLFLLCFLAFIVGNSSEMIAGILIVFLFLMFIAEKIFFKFDNFKALTKKLFVIPITLISGFFLLVTSPDFIRQIQLRNARFPDGFPKPEMLIDFIPQLSYQFVFRHFFILLLIVAGICFLIFIVKSRTSKQIAMVASSGLISWFVFFAALFLSGKTHYEGGFWLIHYDIHFSLQISLLLILAMVVGEIYNYFEQKQDCKKVFISVLLSLIIISIYPFVKNVEYFRYKTDEIRKAMYIYDKMTLFYWYKNQVAEVPYLLSFPDIWAFSQNRLVPLYRDSKYDDVFHKYYMTTTYKNARYCGYYYIEPQKAYEKFYNAGGKLSEEEIETSDFSKLYEKSFVLNEQ